MNKIMKRVGKTFHRGQKGFTLMELLIVVAVLGILAAVLVPNLVTFLSTGQVAKANTEVANLESAALAYYADHSDWPTNATILATANYTDRTPTGTYTFNSFGKVVETGTGTWPDDDNVIWDSGDHKWEKAP